MERCMERSENYIIIYHNISQIGFELFMVMYLMVQVQAVKKKNTNKFQTYPGPSDAWISSICTSWSTSRHFVSLPTWLMCRWLQPQDGEIGLNLQLDSDPKCWFVQRKWSSNMNELIYVYWIRMNTYMIVRWRDYIHTYSTLQYTVYICSKNIWKHSISHVPKTHTHTHTHTHAPEGKESATELLPQFF